MLTVCADSARSRWAGFPRPPLLASAPVRPQRTLRAPPQDPPDFPGDHPGAEFWSEARRERPPHWASPDTYPKPQGVAPTAVLIPSVVLNRMSAYRLTRDPKRPNVDAVPHRHNGKRVLPRA